MPLPNFVAQTDIFFTWLDATNNLTSHVDNTSAYLLVAQNATPRTSSGNIALSGTFTLGTTVLNTSALVANGNFLTTLNASAITTGTLPLAQLNSNVILTTSTTGINASALSTGTVPVARLDANVLLTTSTTGINASAISTGTVPLARLDANVLLTTSTTGINASALSTGTVPTARLTVASVTDTGVVTTTTQSFAGNKTFTNSVTISGNLNVLGTTTSVSANNLIVDDSLIQLAANNLTSDLLDIGLYGNYNGDGGAHEHTGLFRDATDGLWKLFVGLQDAPTSTINTSGVGYAIGTIQTYLTSGGVVANSSGLTVTANNSYSGTLTVNSVTAQTLTGNLTGTASNATNLNSQPGSYYTNASNLNTGTVPIARLDANVILTTSTTGINASALSTGTVPLARLTSASASANGIVDTTTQTFAGNKTFQNTVILQSALTANSGNGSAGQVLTSNGAGVYWANSGAVANTVGGTGAIQFYNGTTLGADANLAFLTNTLTVNGGMTVAANANFDNGVLFVDGINNRVGVNNTGPTTALEVTGTATATTFAGSGASLTSLNASALSTGTVPVGRLDSSVLLTTSTTGINASALSTGTVPVARLDSSVLLTTSTTGINASALSTGTVPLARLSSASASANGVVDTTTQTFAGNKTFSGTVNATSTLGVTGTLTALGQLVVTTNAAFDTNVLFVDAVNNRVGVNNSSPSHAFRVDGTTSINGALNALSTLAVTGATTLSSTLGVTGVATFSANANFDSGVLFVDGTNNRVGVNNAAPTQAFRVDGTTSLNGNVAIGTTNTSAFALLVEGSFAATTKEFNIAHPTRPGKRLRYGVLESPYHGVRLTGRAELTGTEVEVPLPDYLSVLCTDVGSQVQLTNHGHDKILWVDRIDLARNCFVVRMRRRWWDRTPYAFYWAFTGIRQDVEPLDVEPE